MAKLKSVRSSRRCYTQIEVAQDMFIQLAAQISNILPSIPARLEIEIAGAGREWIQRSELKVL